MKISPSDYSVFVFDCDGVILDSNKLKTQAFYRTALPYGESAAQRLVAYHLQHGGVSRYLKFTYFLEKILGSSDRLSHPTLDTLISTYADLVIDGLLSCSLAPGLKDFKNKVATTRWLVASGGDQSELRSVFAHRGIADWFDGGIFGSPDTKEEILFRELATGSIRLPALFLGDSKYDQAVASAAGLDFLFVSDWSEVENWREWVSKNRISNIKNIQELVELKSEVQPPGDNIFRY